MYSATPWQPARMIFHGPPPGVGNQGLELCRDNRHRSSRSLGRHHQCCRFTIHRKRSGDIPDEVGRTGSNTPRFDDGIETWRMASSLYADQPRREAIHWTSRRPSHVLGVRRSIISAGHR